MSSKGGGETTRLIRKELAAEREWIARAARNSHFRLLGLGGRLRSELTVEIQARMDGHGARDVKRASDPEAA